MRINIFCIIDMHCKKHLGATKTAEQKILLQKIYFQLHVKWKTEVKMILEFEIDSNTACIHLSMVV